MRGSPRHSEPPDGFTAPGTGLSGPAIDSKFFLVSSFQTRAADVIANARPTQVDGPIHHRHNSLTQAAGFGSAQIHSPAQRVQVRFK